jgi:hypothetical protein
MNRATACAISLAPNQADWFPFLECLEARAEEAMGSKEELDVPEITKACAVHAGIEPGRVATCYEGGWVGRWVGVGRRRRSAGSRDLKSAREQCMPL